MGGPPRTAVKAVLAPLNGVLARFALPTVRAAAESLLAREDIREVLDEAWQDEELHGCALLTTDPPPLVEWPGLKVVQAYDPVMTLNVLGRSRGGMLVASASLVLDLDHLDRTVFSEDQRLVLLAGRRRRR